MRIRRRISETNKKRALIGDEYDEMDNNNDSELINVVNEEENILG